MPLGCEHGKVVVESSLELYLVYLFICLFMIYVRALLIFKTWR
jgi:hypothetical protein